MRKLVAEASVRSAGGLRGIQQPACRIPAVTKAPLTPYPLGGSLNDNLTSIVD